MTQNDNTIASRPVKAPTAPPPATGCFPAARGSSQAPFGAVVDVRRGDVREADGVLPIESSLAGPVNETHDLLYDSALSIVAEAILPIRHCLVGPAEVPLEDVREIRSHAVALDQCRKLLASMPWATAVDAATTGDAAAAVAELGDHRSSRSRALARPGSTRSRCIARRRGDHEAYTRFAALAPYTRLDRRPGSGGPRSRSRPTTGRCAPRRDRAARARRDRHGPARLAPRSRRGRSTTASTACSAGTRWTRRSPRALAEMRAETARLRVFGSYRADREEGWETVAA